MEKLKRMNKYLVDQYGKEIDGSPKFRLSFSSSENPQMEWRRGHFLEWSGNIFLREIRGIHYVPRYPLKQQQDRWVLEKYFLGMMPKELIGITDRSWEPLYFFPREKNSKGEETGKPIFPNQKAIDFILHNLLYGRKRTKADFEAEDAKEQLDEVNHFLDIQEEGPSYLQMLKGFGEAVFAPIKVFKG